jgi:membrane protease YdiL (CAAX protease family)
MSDPRSTPPPDVPEHTQQSFVDRSGISPVAFAVVSLLLIFVAYFLGSVVIVLFAGGSITRESVWLHRSLTIVGHLTFFLVPVVIASRLLTIRQSELFPWRLPSFRETFFGLLGLFWLQQVFQIYLHFQDKIPLPKELQRLIDPIKQTIEATLREMVRAESLPELAFVLLVVAVVPAIVEEMLFRGFVQGSFQRRFSPIVSAVLTGAIFGFFHLNPFSIVPLVALGCYFGVLRYRSNSIVIAMTAHFLNNTLAVLAVYFGLGEDAYLGSATGIEPSTAAILSQLALYLMLFGISFAAYLRATTEMEAPSPRQGE